MTFKTILVHAENGQVAAERLKCAGALADEFDATVLGLGAEAIPPLYVGPGGEQGIFAGDLISAMSDQIRSDLAASEAFFNSCVGARPKLWRTSWRNPTDAVAHASCAADLIVVGSRDWAAPFNAFRSVDAAELVLTAGRPMLVCPKGHDYLCLLYTSRCV